MFTSIKIAGYRAFEKFELNGLGRINLLVGTNNSGRTSALEAIYLLATRCDPFSLSQLLRRRGEQILPDRRPTRPEIEIDVSHLFTGHALRVGSRFSLSALNQTQHSDITCEIGENIARVPILGQLTFEPGEPMFSPQLAMRISGQPSPPVEVVPLTVSGGIRLDLFGSVGSRSARNGDDNVSPAQFITPESLASDELVTLWNKVALTPNENIVLNALKFLDGDIERIAAQVGSSSYYGAPTRGGFIVKLTNHVQPVPIGSMGDGMWRMLSLAIAITQCRGGVLLIDEIDAGLHYAVMADMWRLIYKAAVDLDVQVFATTHSFDCVISLAKLCVEHKGDSESISVQRIDANKHKAVTYNEDEIIAAAESNIEVR